MDKLRNIFIQNAKMLCKKKKKQVYFLIVKNLFFQLFLNLFLVTEF